MASIKISGLTEQTSASDTDLLPVASSTGIAKRITLENFVKWLAGKFAPSGYGYGGKSIVLSSALLRSDAELEGVLEPIYLAMESGETKLIRFAGYPDNSDYAWFGILSKSSNNYGSLLVQSSYGKGSLVSKAKFGGTWQPLEWVNPRMLLGVEYRTTERYNDKPVYTKLLDCGIASNGKQVNAGVTTIFRHSGNFNFNHSLPHSISQKGNVDYWADSSNAGGTLTLYCGSGFTDTPYNWYEQIWYTKD